MKKDAIVGVFGNYKWDKIKFWANSIDASGFTGDKITIIYHTDGSTVDELVKRGFKIFAFNQDKETKNLYFNGQGVIVVRRFVDLWGFFSSLDLAQYRYIIHTDVKDVIFQTNPSTWLTQNMGNAKLLASSESLQYQHEPWGNDNLAKSFPFIYPKLKDKPIWNCGVQAGTPEVLKDFWYAIWGMCQGNAVHNPDQAAYNVLLSLEPYKSITKFAISEDSWAAQLGTTMDPAKIEHFKPNLLEAQPTWVNDLVCNSTGIPHAIVHQYDRIPEWRTIIENRYS